MAYVMVCAACYYWIRILRGAMLMNVPMCAVLVPRIRTRAIQIACLSWFIATALSTLFYAAMLFADSNCACQSDYFDLIRTTGQLFVISGFVLLTAGLFSISHTIVNKWWFWAIVWFTLQAFHSDIFTSIVISDFSITILTLSLPVITYFSLSRSFLKGGDKHWEKRDGFAEYLNSPALGSIRPNIISPRPAGLASPQRHPIFGLPTMYLKHLHQDCQPGAPWHNLIVHVLGPKAHWSRLPSNLLPLIPKSISGVLIFVLFGLLLYFLKTPAAASSFPLLAFVLNVNVTWVILLGLWFFFFHSLGNCRLLLASTTHEQKLYSLVANYQRNTFNRVLGLQLLRNNFLSWLFFLCLILVLSACVGTPFGTLVRQLCIGSLCLPFICLALDDHSGKPKSFGLTFKIALSMAFPLILLLIFRNEPLWYLWLILCNAVLTLLLIVQRLSVLDRAPFALPAHRNSAS